MLRNSKAIMQWAASTAAAALIAMAALLALAVPSTPAAAQELNDVQLIVNPRLTFERMYRVRTAVRDAVGNRLAPGPAGGNTDTVAVQPAGVMVTPAGDTDVAAANPKWSAWIDGTYTELDDDDPVAGYDASQSVVLAAGDYRATDRFLIGALLAYSESDVDNVIGIFGPGGSTTENHGIGGYMGFVVTDNIVLDASFLYSWIDNEVRGIGSFAEYDGESWNLNANLTGYWYSGNLRWSPTIGVSYARTRDEAYTDSAASTFPSQVTRTGSLSFGMTLGYTIALDDTRTAEPYVSVGGEWEFEESGDPSLAAATFPTDDRELDAGISAGVDVTLASNVSLNLKGNIGGLARKRYRTLGGGGQIAVQF
ncbi:MAG: autotransporter outer membrane beta-barrel domain-containing protein [Hyphomicrobiales bacterium]